MSDLRERSSAIETATKLVERFTGILVPEYRMPILEAELDWLGNGKGLKNGVEKLKAGQSKDWLHLISALTVPETYLFRYLGHFELLRDYADKLAKQGRGCNVLSLGCSTGEEVWSAAAVLSSIETESFCKHSVTGWDICEERLDRARKRQYNSWSCRNGFYDYDEYFLEENSEYIVDSKLERLVSFSRVNFLSEQPSCDPFDVIFFRNVAIYWSEKAIEMAWSRIENLLSPQGLILVGPSDPVTLPETEWKQRIEGNARSFWRVANGDSDQCLSDVEPPAGVVTKPSVVNHSLFNASINHRIKVESKIPNKLDRGNKVPTNGKVHAKGKAPVNRVINGNGGEQLLVKVRILADDGKYCKALDLVNSEDYPNTVEGKLWEGILLLNLKREREATELFRQCVFLSPKEATLRRWLAVGFQALGRKREAEREYRNASELEIR